MRTHVRDVRAMFNEGTVCCWVNEQLQIIVLHVYININYSPRCTFQSHTHTHSNLLDHFISLLPWLLSLRVLTGRAVCKWSPAFGAVWNMKHQSWMLKVTWNVAVSAALTLDAVWNVKHQSWMLKVTWNVAVSAALTLDAVRLRLASGSLQL